MNVIVTILENRTWSSLSAATAATVTVAAASSPYNASIKLNGAQYRSLRSLIISLFQFNYIKYCRIGNGSCSINGIGFEDERWLAAKMHSKLPFFRKSDRNNTSCFFNLSVFSWFCPNLYKFVRTCPNSTAFSFFLYKHVRIYQIFIRISPESSEFTGYLFEFLRTLSNSPDFCPNFPNLSKFI